MSNLIRPVAISLACVLLAAFLAMQAISGVLSKRDPIQAVVLLPNNGAAWERLAFGKFQEKAGASAAEDRPIAIRTAASSARVDALKAIEMDPLAPQAYAVLALSTKSSDEKERLLELASKLNRHDTVLQSLVMGQAAANEDYEKVLQTLDRILRVRPSLLQQFTPLLLDALATPGSAPAFAEYLDGTSPWHEAFLLSAASASPEVQIALASIRSDLEVENIEFDRRLIRGLVSQSAMIEANRIYRVANKNNQQATESSGKLTWDSAFPPIDWELTDRNDFRAQPSRDERFLEVFARAGQGGVIARRFIDEGFEISSLDLEVRASRHLEAHNLRLQLRCNGSETPFHEASLTNGANRVIVPAIPGACTTLNLEIFVRSLSGEPTLRAELGRIKILP